MNEQLLPGVRKTTDPTAWEGIHRNSGGRIVWTCGHAHDKGPSSARRCAEQALKAQQRLVDSVYEGFTDALLARLAAQDSEFWEKADDKTAWRRGLPFDARKADPVDVALYCALLWWHSQGDGAEPNSSRAR